MSDLAITKDLNGNFDEVCLRVPEVIKSAGFGILTRIDFDQKIKEKTGETINRCTILGACNPKLALEAYKQSSDVALLIPCNITVTEIGPNHVRVEAMRPTQMLEILKGLSKNEMITNAEEALAQAIGSL